MVSLVLFVLVMLHLLMLSFVLLLLLLVLLLVLVLVVDVVVVGVVGVVVVVRRPGTHRNTTTPGVRSDPHLLPLFRGSQLCSFKERAPKYCAAYPVYVRCAITNFKWW
jgi:hypothetical protein